MGVSVRESEELDKNKVCVQINHSKTCWNPDHTHTATKQQQHTWGGTARNPTCKAVDLVKDCLLMQLPRSLDNIQPLRSVCGHQRRRCRENLLPVDDGSFCYCHDWIVHLDVASYLHLFASPCSGTTLFSCGVPCFLDIQPF